MDRMQRIAELERERRAAEDVVVEAQAALAGVKSQLAIYYQSVEDRSDLAGLSRTDAIIEVLHRATTALTVDEIMGALDAGGRHDEDRKTVRATLSYLEKSERIKRPARGSYTVQELRVTAGPSTEAR